MPTMSLRAAVREEGDAVLLDLLLVALPVGLAIDQPAGHRPLVDAEPEHQPEVQPDERDQEPRDHEDVQR